MLERGKQNLRTIDPVANGNTRPGLTEGVPLGRIGSLEVRLARNAEEVAAAQELRFRIFYQELGARLVEANGTDQRDSDRFDPICDHLLVFDNDLDAPAYRRIVGTYRLLRQEVAEKGSGFYSSEMFDIGSLVDRHPNMRFLELGRSCVLPEYRSRRTIEVLWQGIWAYVHHYRISVLTGCASFHGTEPGRHAEALTFLARNCRAEQAWDVPALPERYSSMDLMPGETLNAKSAMAAMPPLIKGYLRLNARFGDGCVIDHEFGTTVVLVILPMHTIAQRYLDYYRASEARFLE